MRPEDRLQARTAMYLDAALPPSAFWTSIIPERKQSPAAGMRMRARGAKSGLADVFIWWSGRFFAVELKAGSNRLQDNQRAFAIAIRRNGFDAWEVRSVEALHDLLEGAGVPVSAGARVAALHHDAALSVPEKPRKAGVARVVKVRPTQAQIRRVGILRDKVPF